jgi:hypothetical protein
MSVEKERLEMAVDALVEHKRRAKSIAGDEMLSNNLCLV